MEKFLKQWTEKTIRKGILFTALGLLWIFVVGSAANVGYDILHPETVKWEKKGGSNGDGSESEEEIFFKDVDPVKYAAKKGWDFFLASSVTGNRLYELGWFLVWVGDLVYIGEYLEEDYGLISLLVVVSCLLYLTTYGPWGWLGTFWRHGLWFRRDLPVCNTPRGRRCRNKYWCLKHYTPLEILNNRKTLSARSKLSFVLSS